MAATPPSHKIGVNCAGVAAALPYVFDVARYVVVRGAEFFVGGVLDFGVDVPVGRIERHCHGYRVLHNGLIYGKSNHNLAFGIRRLLGVRFPLEPGVHEQLFDQQRAFLRTAVVLDFIEAKSRFLRRRWPQTGFPIEELLVYKGMKHPKRELRLLAVAEMACQGQLDSEVKNRTIDFKLKLHEEAKFGKWPRNIADMGVQASLRGFIPTQCYKIAEDSEVFVHDECGYLFVKSPDRDALRKAFRLVVEHPFRTFFLYFSDDGVFSANTPEGKHIYNVDIKSCESSHTSELFAALANVVPLCWQDRFRELNRQLLWKFKLRDATNKKPAVVIKPLVERLFSGSSLTTVINNFANCCIGFSLSQYYHRGWDVQQCANYAGIRVDVERVLKVSDIQFLKCSPCVSEEDLYDPVLNLGVLLRSVGVSKGPLPGRSYESLERRAHLFQSALLRSFFNKDRAPFIDRIRARHPEMSVVKLPPAINPFEDKLFVKCTRHFSDASYLDRYNLEGCELVSVVESLADMRPGMVAANSGFRKILMKDYGLTC